MGRDTNCAGVGTYLSLIDMPYLTASAPNFDPDNRAVLVPVPVRELCLSVDNPPL